MTTTSPIRHRPGSGANPAAARLSLSPVLRFVLSGTGLLCLLLAAPLPSPAAEPDIRRDAAVTAIERVLPSVVNIATETVIPYHDWYDDVLRDAAANELMVDFHGAVKPTGRERTWPNEMSREAVAGREQGKSPALHDITLPFLRYVQGHADFTPTLLIPSRLDKSSFAHELAMSIVFTSPYLCMGDNPTNYLNSAAADVIKALPSVWNETRVLPGSEIGQLAAFARRSGDQWFIGVINDLTPRRHAVALNFLAKRGYKVVELSDDAERNDAFVRTERNVTSKDTLTLPLRKDGGYVAWLIPLTDK